MKKKLITGLGLITLIFIASGVFILVNLNIINTNHKIKEHQERIIIRYGDILSNLRGAQSELYRHQAGYSRDINSLVDYVLALEDMLLLTRSDYTDYLGNASCNNCHLVEGKVETLDKTIDQTSLLLARYKERISSIVTLKDFELAKSLDVKAAKDGDEIIDLMNELRHAALKMNEMMEESHIASVRRATYSIAAAIGVSVMLSALVVLLIIRSITGPLDLLVRGIENVSSGEYGAKVDIPTKDEIGFVAQTFNAMTDNLNKVTRQKELLMGQLQELNSDLERRIQEATEELRITHENMLRSETLSVVGTFASGVAHELATPMSSIISYFQMMKGKMPEQLAEDADMIEGELHRCRNILRGMLNFARAPEKDKTLTDVNSIIRDLLALVGYQTEYRKTVITEDLDPRLPAVMAIPGQIRQVFMNIIVNALQSMSEGGNLKVSTSMAEDSGAVVATISDTGCGIPEGDINRIFQPFYTSKQSGTGLGLSISYGIIKAHGGDIAVKSEPGKGTTFSVSMPVSENKTY
jgi:two-component system NtrC family sensor kinase